MIRQANKKDIPVIEEILLDAVMWMHKEGFDNLWNESNTKWNELSKNYKIEDFYISYDKEIPTACMALTEYDATYWPNVPKGKSLYIHKLAVKRAYAGKSSSRELFNFAKNLAYKYQIPAIRLDCNQQRQKLRELYEKNGFVCVDEVIRRDGYGIALYICNL